MERIMKHRKQIEEQSRTPRPKVIVRVHSSGSMEVDRKSLIEATRSTREILSKVPPLEGPRLGRRRIKRIKHDDTK